MQGGSVRCISPHSPGVLRSPQHADYDAYGAMHTELRVSLNGADYEDPARSGGIWRDLGRSGPIGSAPLRRAPTSKGRQIRPKCYF